MRVLFKLTFFIGRWKQKMYFKTGKYPLEMGKRKNFRDLLNFPTILYLLLTYFREESFVVKH